MNTKTKFGRLGIMFSIALILTLAVAPAGKARTQAMSSDKVVHFKVNGLFFYVLFGDGSGELGFLNVGLDQETNTVGLDFGYSVPDVTNPNNLIIYQGAGDIPTESFTVTRESAHLAVTTPASFFIQRCNADLTTGEFTCGLADPISFDLTWVTNNLLTVSEKVERTETYLGTITMFKGEWTRVSAAVSGTWGDGLAGENMFGSVLDTQNKTSYRDITIKKYP